MKKSRLNNDDNDDDDEKKSNFTRSFACTSLPKPIVADEFIVDVSLRDAYIGILRNKRDTAIAIKSITSILPGFCHLKRCFNGQLLLAFVDKLPVQHNNDVDPSFSSECELKKFLNDKNFDLQLLEETFTILPVPKHAPRTKSQAKIASNMWPLNFHPDNSIELLLSDNFFNTTQLNIINTCMKICIEASKREAIGNDYCNGSAVILDPNEDGIARIIAIASCRINEHPMWHAAMLAIDLVSKFRGGGAWKLESTCATTSLDINTFCKRKFSLNSPFCYPASLNNLNISKFSHSAFDYSKLNRDNDNGNSNNCSYLCTNYWVFLLEEPCSLCAMALLHSRVSMIFYGVSNKSHGILGSKALLHTMPGLNHRYKVWSNILESDCKKTAMEIHHRANIII